MILLSCVVALYGAATGSIAWLLARQYVRAVPAETARRRRPIRRQGTPVSTLANEGLLRLAQAVYAFTDRVTDCPCQRGGRCWTCGR